MIFSQITDDKADLISGLIHYDSVDSYEFVTKLQSESIIWLNKNQISEWRSACGLAELEITLDPFRRYQLDIRRRAIINNYVIVNPGLKCKIFC